MATAFLNLFPVLNYAENYHYHNYLSNVREQHNLPTITYVFIIVLQPKFQVFRSKIVAQKKQSKKYTSVDQVMYKNHLVQSAVSLYVRQLLISANLLFLLGLGV